MLQRLLASLDTRFHANDIIDALLNLLVERHQKIDSWRLFARYGRQQGLHQRAGFDCLEIGLQLVFQRRFVHEREFASAFLKEEIKRVEDRHLGDEIDLDFEGRCLFREDQARQIVALRVLLPIDEMLGRRDLQRIRQDRRPAMRRGTQSDDLGTEAYRSIVAIGRAVI